MALWGGNNRDGTNKTGKALSAHNSAVIKQQALQRAKDQQAAAKAQKAAEAQRQLIEAERARAAAAAAAQNAAKAAVTQATASTPPSQYDLNASPDRLTTPVDQDTPEQAPKPTPTPPAAETTESVDPAWAPSATPAQQATNIKKARKFTEKQLEIARKANETKALGRQQVNEYLDQMKQERTNGRTSTETAAQTRRRVWENAKKSAKATASANNLSNPETMEYWLERQRILIAEEFAKAPDTHWKPTPTPQPNYPTSPIKGPKSFIEVTFDRYMTDEEFRAQVDKAIQDLTGPDITDIDPGDGPMGPPPVPTGAKKESTKASKDLKKVVTTYGEAAMRAHLAREKLRRQLRHFMRDLLSTPISDKFAPPQLQPPRGRAPRFLTKQAIQQYVEIALD